MREKFIDSIYGKRDAKRFCDALEEGRIIAIIRRVSKSGMQRVIQLFEICTYNDKNHKCNIFNFDYLAQEVGGFKMDKYNGNIIKGCGMDMTYHMIDTIVEGIYQETNGEYDVRQYKDNYRRL